MSAARMAASLREIFEFSVFCGIGGASRAAPLPTLTHPLGIGAIAEDGHLGAGFGLPRRASRKAHKESRSRGWHDHANSLNCQSKRPNKARWTAGELKVVCPFFVLTLLQRSNAARGP